MDGLLNEWMNISLAFHNAIKAPKCFYNKKDKNKKLNRVK